MPTHHGSTSARPDNSGSDHGSESAVMRAAFRALTQGVIVNGGDGRILQVNPAAEQILGLTAAQLSGLTPRHPGLRSVHEDGSPFPGEEHPV